AASMWNLADISTELLNVRYLHKADIQSAWVWAEEEAEACLAYPPNRIAVSVPSQLDSNLSD
ncbi:MAG: hypothetical protein WA767_18725, partial [Pseudolabrys sp.]